MNIRKTILQITKSPIKLPLAILHRLVDVLPDWIYLTLKFKLITGEWPNIRNPKTFNEKLQWLKLYDHNPLYSIMVDKYAVKNYVGKLIGEDYIVKTLGVWDKVEDIDFNSLPNKFVLKTTHGGGSFGVVICKDKISFDTEAAKNKLKASMLQNMAKYNKEWPYQDVPRKILAEEFLEPNEGENELHDYKVLCFGGKAKLIEYHSGRNSGNHTQDFYDVNWVKQDIEQCEDPLSSGLAPKPEKLEEMIEMSNILSKDIPHCRVDWYYLRGKLYFGEITFYDASGMCLFVNKDDDIMLGSWITLPTIIKK